MERLLLPPALKVVLAAVRSPLRLATEVLRGEPMVDLDSFRPNYNPSEKQLHMTRRKTMTRTALLGVLALVRSTDLGR
jgi:hypothetical protein